MENDYNKRKFTVYCHTNKINGKRYIGQTSQEIEKRWKSNGAGYEKCPLFWKAIQKYGWDNFEHTILKDNLSLDEANYWEQYYINYYHTWIEDPLCQGYNLRKGGENSLLAEETKQKISESKKGENNYNYGQHLSKETRDKLSAIMIEKWKDPEFKEKMVAPRRGVPLSEENKRKIGLSNKGKKRTPEQIQHMREAQKNKKADEIVCLETGEIFPSVKIAAAKVGMQDGSNILKACRGDRRTAANLHWMKLKDLPDTELATREEKIQEIEEERIKNKNKAAESKTKKVRCINTDEIFSSATEAGKKYNCSKTSIQIACRDKTKHAGKMLETLEPLSWEYIT